MYVCSFLWKVWYRRVTVNKKQIEILKSFSNAKSVLGLVLKKLLLWSILNYNVARALVLCKSYWAIMNKIFMYARPFSIKWRVQFISSWNEFSCKISVAFSASFFCLSFGNVKIILNNPNPTLSLWICLAKIFGNQIFTSTWVFWLCLSPFSLSICTLLAWLRFHYNLA